MTRRGIRSRWLETTLRARGEEKAEGIEPGGDDVYLEAGGEFDFVQNSVILEDVLEKLIKRGKNIERRLERMERIEKPVLERRRMQLELSGWRGSNKVLEINNLDKIFDADDGIRGDLDDRANAFFLFPDSLLGLFPLLARKSMEAITRARAARANAAGTESNG